MKIDSKLIQIFSSVEIIRYREFRRTSSFLHGLLHAASRKDNAMFDLINEMK